MPLSKWFLSKKGQKDDNKRSGKSLKQLVNEYGLSSNLFRLQVIKDSRLLGKTIIDLDIRRKYGLNIMEVRRGDASQHRFLKTITQKFAAPDTMLEVEDILYVTGDFDKVQLFAEDTCWRSWATMQRKKQKVRLIRLIFMISVLLK